MIRMIRIIRQHLQSSLIVHLQRNKKEKEKDKDSKQNKHTPRSIGVF